MSAKADLEPVDTLIVAVRETAGSALYGLLDVLSAVGDLWVTLTGEGVSRRRFRVRIVSPEPGTFDCGNGIPVRPDCHLSDALSPDLVILPELWLAPTDSIHGRYPALMDWIRRYYAAGGSLYSACSGSVMLAETGLLDGCPATSHWGYRDLFRQQYPQVRFQPEPSLVCADAAGRLVTAGGTTSWHDLALHIIARYAGAAEALRIARVYLLKWHTEGQLPYTPLVRQALHSDAVVSACEQRLRRRFREDDAIRVTLAASGLPARTLKRRFRNATGVSLMDYLQNLRVEEAKRMLESTTEPVDEIAAAVGYEDTSFFRRLFKRLAGLTPGQYRRMFHPVGRQSGEGDGAVGLR